MSEMHEADAMTTYVNEFELSEVGIDPGRAGISRWDKTSSPNFAWQQTPLERASHYRLGIDYVLHNKETMNKALVVELRGVL